MNHKSQDNGAVITDYRRPIAQHRDLPARRRDKTFSQPVYSSKQAFFFRLMGLYFSHTFNF
jgi:hypothetical protein